MEHNSKKGVRVYNVLFPIWMLFLFFPQVWLVVLPGNFLIDSLVLVLAMKFLQVAGKKEVWKKSIVRVWCYGFLADLIGAAALVAFLYADVHLGLDLFDYSFQNSLGQMLYSLPAVALSGVIIYLLNKKFAFGKTALSMEQRHKLALALAIFTAPYTFMIPLSWLYS